MKHRKGGPCRENCASHLTDVIVHRWRIAKTIASEVTRMMETDRWTIMRTSCTSGAFVPPLNPLIRCCLYHDVTGNNGKEDFLQC